MQYLLTQEEFDSLVPLAKYDALVAAYDKKELAFWAWQECVGELPEEVRKPLYAKIQALIKERVGV